jgi:hypothetical protein
MAAVSITHSHATKTARTHRAAVVTSPADQVQRVTIAVAAPRHVHVDCSFLIGYGGQLWFRSCMAAHDEGVAVIRKVSWLKDGAYMQMERNKIQTVQRSK